MRVVRTGIENANNVLLASNEGKAGIAILEVGNPQCIHPNRKHILLGSI